MRRNTTSSESSARVFSLSSSASADGGKCPLDGTKLEARDDAVDLAIHHTVLHGGTFVRLGAGALADADGIGAILRF